MIKAVIFDIGGVLLKIKPLLNRTQKVFDCQDKSKFWEVINSELIPLCKEKITLLQFWKNVSKKLNKKIPDSILKDLWVKDFEKLTSVNKDVERIATLLKKNYKLAIVSNIIKEHVKITKKLNRFDGFKMFDVVVFSNEVRLTKKEKRIFLLAAKKLKLKPEECIFIDDTEEFLEKPKELGMKTIHFKNCKQLKSDLIKNGVKF